MEAAQERRGALLWRSGRHPTSAPHDGVMPRLRAAGATVVCEGVLGTQRRLYRFTHPMDPTEARGGIAVRLK